MSDDRRLEECLALLTADQPDISGEERTRLAEILASEDFCQTFIKTETCSRHIVEECYTSMLQRMPDEDGFIAHRTALDQLDLSSVIRNFLTSSEFKERFALGDGFTGHEEIVAALYAVLLERAADDRGIDIYAAALRTGMSVEKLLIEFMGYRSTEFARDNAGDGAALLDLCTVAREMMTRHLADQGCRIRLGPPAAGGSGKAASAKAADLLYTLQMLKA